MTQPNSHPFLDDLTIAKQTIHTEIAGLKLLEESLGEPFLQAVDLMFNTKGKALLSGMGKSGHIARKIAATLASTGTPAFFVHPSEAMHGDLGMLSTSDCVILISNSGNSSELLSMASYCLKRSIPSVVITSDGECELAQASTLWLPIPKVTEACPFGKAPTTSTTVTLVLGDCLAMALLSKKGFTSDNFKDVHPAGAIGASLQKVSEIMHTGKALPLVPETATMQEAILTITSKRLGCCAVVNAQGSMVGIITDGDLRKNMKPDLLGQKVTTLMNPNFVAISKNTFVAAALQLMHTKKITNLLIVDDHNVPEGIVHIHDMPDIR